MVPLAGGVFETVPARSCRARAAVVAFCTMCLPCVHDGYNRSVYVCARTNMSV